MTTAFPAAPSSRPQRNECCPQHHRERRWAGVTGQGGAASLHRPSCHPFSPHPPSVASDDRSLVTAPCHSPAASEHRREISWLGARGDDLVIRAGARCPPLPAQDGRGRSLAPSFLEALVGSGSCRDCLLTALGPCAMPGGPAQCTCPAHLHAPELMPAKSGGASQLTVFLFLGTLGSPTFEDFLLSPSHWGLVRCQRSPGSRYPIPPGLATPTADGEEKADLVGT